MDNFILAFVISGAISFAISFCTNFVKSFCDTAKKKSEKRDKVISTADELLKYNEFLQIAFADNIAEAKEKAKKDAELEAEKERIAAEKQAEAERILAEERCALAEEKEQRHKAYWEEHTEERAALIAKKEKRRKH